MLRSAPALATGGWFAPGATGRPNTHSSFTRQFSSFGSLQRKRTRWPRTTCVKGAETAMLVLPVCAAPGMGSQLVPSW